MRTTGRFYTPPLIGQELSNKLALTWDSNVTNISIVDPFCGDGRLVLWLIEALKKRCNITSVDIELWDLDETAVDFAVKSLRGAVKSFCAGSRVRGFKGDSFQRAKSSVRRFDIVITNPPWDVLKPDRRELLCFTAEEREEYIKRLRNRDRDLAHDFSMSRPARRFSGWGTNLARVGTELAGKLCKPGGMCGVVSPASLLADQNSIQLRRWLFTNFKLEHVSYFPAEGRFFAGVDQPTITVMLKAVCPRAYSRARLCHFDSVGKMENEVSVDISPAELSSQDWTIPIFMPPDWDTTKNKLRALPKWVELEHAGKLWAGRELDETKSADFLRESGRVRFAKGRMVSRYKLDTVGSLYVDEVARKIPTTSSFVRIGWRDVSRPTQRRRMHATLIPPNWTAGNSINVAYFSGAGTQKLLALLSVVNSIVFESQIRLRSATAHLSLGVVRQARLPNFNCRMTVKSLAAIAAKCLQGSIDEEREAEIIVAKSYGLSRDEFEATLQMFPKLEKIERALLLGHRAWHSSREVRL